MPEEQEAKKNEETSELEEDSIASSAKVDKEY